MPEPADRNERDADPAQSVPDWEAFYANYRKPGYIHGFEIGPKLGGGVFGVVFKARKESIGKSYAIKFLRVEDPGVRDQVLRELDTVRLFAQVDHPNLVSIEDQGVVDGIPFIVMGYAGDETLRDRFQDGGLSEAEALQLFVQVARGVAALHEHALVHFDLKPANVFLKGDIARVGDYGLSKLVTESAMSLSTGRGTPYYMAPEMLRRKGDHRSDIYSLGVLLFEALAGEVPFQGDSEWEVLKGHEEKPVEFPARISEHYRPLLRKALAKRPEDRFASVAEMLDALRAPSALEASIRFDRPARSAATPDLGAAMAIADDAIDQARAARAAARSRRGHADGDSGRGWWPFVLLFLAFVFWNRSLGIRVGGFGVSMSTIFLVAGIWMLWPRRASEAAMRAAPAPRRRSYFGFVAVFVLFFVLLAGATFMFAADGFAPSPQVSVAVASSPEDVRLRELTRHWPLAPSAVQGASKTELLSAIQSLQGSPEPRTRKARNDRKLRLHLLRQELERRAVTTPALVPEGNR